MCYYRRHTAVGLTDAHIDLALDGCLVQRSEVPVVPCIRVGPVSQQCGHHLRVAERAGIVQWNETTCRGCECGVVGVCVWCGRGIPSSCVSTLALCSIK